MPRRPDPHENHMLYPERDWRAWGERQDRLLEEEMETRRYEEHESED